MYTAGQSGLFHFGTRLIDTGSGVRFLAASRARRAVHQVLICGAGTRGEVSRHMREIGAAW